MQDHDFFSLSAFQSPQKSPHATIPEAPRPSAEVCKSRFIESVSVPQIPKGPPSHDPRDIHRFSKVQDCPQRSPSHDLSSLSVLQSLQKGPEATILETFIVFRESKIVPRGPQVTIYRPCRRFRASRRGTRELYGRVSRARSDPRTRSRTRFLHLYCWKAYSKR